jgi:hypothetical protein
MSVKNKSIFFIFIVLVIILTFNPRMIYNSYKTILGRTVLIGLIIFLAMNNISLALIVSFIIILVLNNYGNFVEGFDKIIGEDNIPDTGKLQVLTKDLTSQISTSKQPNKIGSKVAAKISELKQAKQQGVSPNSSTSEGGIDTTSLQDSVKSVPANSIPVNQKDFRSEDVKPFSQSMLTNDSSLTEGFCPCAASLVF